ncbi:hypothetical protein ABZ876_37310 [Streptomyces sp. NPDC046931]|uniref:hypothetical protein n=1 Tax=Streptomyces sp. NPDC046931 TaxID=3154806 RepID=UPI0033EA82AA
MDVEGVCRLCRKQTPLIRGAHGSIVWRELGRRGQQLFLADLFSSRHRGAAIGEPVSLRPDTAARRLVHLRRVRIAQARGNSAVMERPVTARPSIISSEMGSGVKGGTNTSAAYDDVP